MLRLVWEEHLKMNWQNEVQFSAEKLPIIALCCELYSKLQFIKDCFKSDVETSERNTIELIQVPHKNTCARAER